MELVFLVIQLIIAAALIGIVLMQRSSSDGFGLGSGSGSNFLSGRQSANFLTRTTAVLATLFIFNSLWLGILAANQSSTTLADEIEAQVPRAEDPQRDRDAEPAPVPSAEGVEAIEPAVPDSPEGGRRDDPAAPQPQTPAAGSETPAQPQSPTPVVPRAE